MDGNRETTVPLPSALMAEVRQAAQADGTTPAAWVQDAVTERLQRLERQRQWADLTAYGRRQAERLGVGPDDVEALIGEYRRERRERGR
jgi:hypothetical protein